MKVINDRRHLPWGKVLLITLSGRDFYVAEYLKKQVSDLSVFSYLHSSTYRRGRILTYEHYKDGTKDERIALPSHFASIFLALRRINRGLLQVPVQILIVLHTLRLRKRFDVCIASNTVDSIAGFLLRILRATKLLVSVTQDHIDPPSRLSLDAISDLLFRELDKISQDHADCVWYLSDALLDVKRKFGFIKNYSVPRIILTQPIDPSRAMSRNFSNVDRHVAVYAGRIGESSGLDIVIQAFESVAKIIPDARLKIFSVGDAKDEARLSSLIERFGLGRNVVLRGFVPDRSLMLDEMASCAFGIAPQPPTVFGYLQPNAGKIKDYLSCGLPVLTTSETALSREIREANAGLVIEYDVDQFRESLQILLTRDDVLSKYSANASRLALSYDYNYVFEGAIAKMLVLLSERSLRKLT